MTKIKICGMMRCEDIEAVNEAMPDYIGFVFARNRKRTVAYETAAEMKKKLDKRINAVGVFLNNEMTEIEKLCKDGIIDIVQLHGSEDEAFIRELRKRISNPVIKAVSVRSAEDIISAETLPVDYLLLDTYKKGIIGGTGESFDWRMIPKINKPFFLAGGLNETNIEAAMNFGAYGLDVSSGAETNGKKDKIKILSIIRKVRGD